MAFRRGDLLEVVEQSDERWWQAYKLPCAASASRLNLEKQKVEVVHQDQLSFVLVLSSSLQPAEGAVVEPTLPRSRLHQGQSCTHAHTR